MLRHRERFDPDRGPEPVSAGLGVREDLAAIDAMGAVTELARRIFDDTLPDGISQRTARRMLFERKVEAYDLVAERSAGATAREARTHSAEAWEQLVAWHRSDVRERLGHEQATDDELTVLLDGAPVRILTRTVDRDPDVQGWWLWPIGRDGRVDPLDVGGESVAPVDAGPLAAAAAAVDVVCEHVATDAAKGIAPFGPGGIAEPPIDAESQRRREPELPPAIAEESVRLADGAARARRLRVLPPPGDEGRPGGRE